MAFKIRTKLILIIVLSLLLTVSFFYFTSGRTYGKSVDNAVTKAIVEAERSFHQQEKGDIDKLSAALTTFLENERFKRVFITGDREKLFDAGRDLFSELNKNFGITHFYFHLPEGKTFLRLHNKDIHGDDVNRATFIKSRETGLFSGGIELGKTAFALRVVAPYRLDGKIVGYVEFGEEIDHFLDTLKGQTRNEFAIITKKEHLNHEDWGSVRKNAGLPDTWDELGRYLWISKSLDNPFAKSCFTEGYISKFEKGPSYVKDFPGEKDGFACGGFPIYDPDGKPVGTIMALIDVSDQTTMIGKMRNDSISIFAILTMATIAVIVFLVRRHISEPLERLSTAARTMAKGDLSHKIEVNSSDEIGELADSMNIMAREINNYCDNLKVMVDERTKELKDANEELSVLYQVAMVISRTIDLQKLLYDILYTVIGMDTFNIERKGAIFVVEGDKLTLISHVGYDSFFSCSDREVKVGECLCGIAAKSGEILISKSSDTDEDHSIKYYGMVNHGHVIVPLKAGNKTNGVLCLYIPPDAEISSDRLSLLNSIGGQIGIAIENARLYEETKALSLHDPLTGLANRRYMEMFLDRGFNEAKRYNKPFSVIMMDIDFFKKYNDSHGHQAGDKLLSDVAGIISETVRDVDLVARYGGEEFFVLLPNTDAETAAEVAERLRASVEAKSTVTISLGSASYIQGIQTKEELVHRADSALYAAKRKGRNRVVAADGPA